MPTGDKETRIYNKVLLNEAKLGDHFLVFLHDLINDLTEASFLSSGTLSDQKIGLTSSANDTFTLDLTNADKVLTNGGLGSHIVNLSLAPSAEISNYPFENATGITYYVGILYQQVPTGIEPNPRTGEPEYPYLLESLGELGDPDSVTDNTTYIRLVINGILEPNVDHSGRPVTVWLKDPVSNIDTVAFYNGVVAYSAPNNYVDIPYGPGAGPLGQTAPTFPISTDTTKYQVHVRGASWFRNTDLRTVPSYAFIGLIVGNGPGATPVSFDITDQKAALAQSLDRAYRANSTAVPAPGRTIDVDSWAVILRQRSNTQREDDPWNTPLIVDRLDETISGGQGHTSIFSWDPDYSYAGLTLKNAADAASGGDLQPTEVANLSGGGNTITLTRGAVDLGTAGSDFEGVLGSVVYVCINGTLNPGLYKCIPATVNTLTATNLDGSAVSFAAETGATARLYVPAQEDRIFDPLLPTYSDDNYAFQKYFDKNSNGLRVQFREVATDERWFSATAKERGFGSGAIYNNEFFRIQSGRMLMRGGNARVSQNRPGGYPRYQVDVLDTSNLESIWIPSESHTNWGFDYRGQDFGKSTTGEDPAYHLMGSFRHPFWLNTASAILEEEDFTRFDTETLTLTRGAVDLTRLPGNPSTDPDASEGNAWVYAEVLFDTPGSADGNYWVKEVDVGNDRVVLMDIEGGTPSFPVGTGKIRFYGGDFIGPSKGEIGDANIDAWIKTITCPTENTGGLRIINPFDGFQILCAGISDVNFLVKNGRTFTDVITTRSAASISGLSSGDADFLNLYATETHLSGTTYSLRLPSGTVGTNHDVVRPESGTWTYDHVIPKFRGYAESYSPGYNQGFTLTAFGNALQDVFTATQNGLYVLPFQVPQGCTINSISIYVLPAITTMTLYAGRQQFGSTTTAFLAATAVSPPTTTLQTLTLTCTQNNTNVDTRGYEYKIIINVGASAVNTEIYGVSVNVTVSALGQSWFECV